MSLAGLETSLIDLFQRDLVVSRLRILRSFGHLDRVALLLDSWVSADRPHCDVPGHGVGSAVSSCVLSCIPEYFLKDSNKSFC